MKGLNEGVKTMQVGGKRILVIPAYLAYNYVTIFSQENPNVVIIPGGSALVCYIEMLSFKQL
jgi:FKBP-type peptidyl-prolyl cis-trans isomerase